jgi:hypothetical protein
MSLKDKKQKIFGEIAAARTLIDGMPKLKLSSSFPSVNNGNDIILFLTDLVKALVGQSKLIQLIVDTLTKTLDNIETKLKVVLKTALKNLVTCGVNPTIPAFLKSTGSGIVIRVDKIDFFDQFKTDPLTPAGRLMYNDITPILTNSSDFNTFLYGVIQDEPVTHTWQGILDIKFESLGTNGNPNNSFIIKTSPAYDNKTLNDLNDNYIDSIDLFDSKDIVNKIIDILFGSISITTNKSRKQLQKEAEINDIIDRLSNSDSFTEINDDYFTFTNEEVAQQESNADDRRNGIIKVKTSVETEATMPIGFLSDFTDNILLAGTLVQKRTVIANSLNNMADNIASQIPNRQDAQTVKISFVMEMIRSLIKAIASVMISPKIIVIFLINFKIIYGLSAEYLDAIDFIKKNRTLFQSMFKSITTLVTSMLMSIVMKEVTQLAGNAVTIKMIDKTQNKKQQLLSLVGVPQDAIRRIKGFL